LFFLVLDRHIEHLPKVPSGVNSNNDRNGLRPENNTCSVINGKLTCAHKQTHRQNLIKFWLQLSYHGFIVFHSIEVDGVYLNTKHIRKKITFFKCWFSVTPMTTFAIGIWRHRYAHVDLNVLFQNPFNFFNLKSGQGPPRTKCISCYVKCTRCCRKLRITGSLQIAHILFVNNVLFSRKRPVGQMSFFIEVNTFGSEISLYTL